MLSADADCVQDAASPASPIVDQHSTPLSAATNTGLYSATVKHTFYTCTIHPFTRTI